MLWLTLACAVLADVSPGRLTGTVTGPDGARLPGVTVVVTVERDGPSGAAADGVPKGPIRLSTGDVGAWRSPELAPGRYAVELSLAGFETRREAGVAVRAGELTRLDQRLDVAAVRESVSVVGVAPRATLEASELREGSAHDLGEALGWKAGLWRLRKGGIANDVVLRGLQSRDLNVLIDGQRVYGACPNHMDPAAFHVDFAEIDRVEVARGPFDAKNQGGLGGTVNVITRKPEPGWHGGAQLAVGSFAAVNPSLTLGRGGQQLSALAGYSYRRSDPYRDGAGRRFTELANYRPAAQDAQAFSAGTAWGRVLWKPAEGHQLDLAYTRQDAGSTLYPYLLMDAIHDDADRLNFRYEATGLGARRASARVQGYLTQVDHYMTDESRTSSVGKPRDYSMGTQADTRTFGGKAEAVLGGLTLGVEGYERRWDATNEMAGSGYAPQAMVPGVVVRVAGAFAEYERRLGGGLALAAGGRLDGRAARRIRRWRTSRSTRRTRPRARSPRATRCRPASCASRGGAPAGSWARAWATRRARPRRPSATSPCAAWGPTGSATRTWCRAQHGPRRSAAFEHEASGPSWAPTRATSPTTSRCTTRRAAAPLPGVTNAVARSFANVDATLRGLELEASLPILFERVFVSGDVSYVRGTQDGDGARGIAAGDLAEMPPLRGRLVGRYDDGRFSAARRGRLLRRPGARRRQPQRGAHAGLGRAEPLGRCARRPAAGDARRRERLRPALRRAPVLPARPVPLGRPRAGAGPQRVPERVGGVLSVRRSGTAIVLASALVSASLLGLVWLDYRATRGELLELLREQASQLQAAVAAAASSNRSAAALAERQLGERLLDQARSLARLDAEGRLTQAEIDALVAREPLFRVAVFGSAGRREPLGSWTAGNGHGPGPGGPEGAGGGAGTGGGPGRGGGFAGGPSGRGLLQEILRGEREEGLTGIHANRWGTADRLSAAARRKGGGAILLSVDATAVAAIAAARIPRALLEEMTRGNPDIAYVVIEETTAASPWARGRERE